MTQLVGALTKDADRRRGRVLAEGESEVAVRWFDGSAFTDEVVSRDSDKIKILTMEEGWTPLSSIGYTMSEAESLLSELRSILDEAQSKKKSRSVWKKRGAKMHSPYKNLRVIGPGPNKEFETRVVGQTIDWDCNRIGPYKQRCVGKDSETGKRYTKVVSINKSYKKAYNKAYKAWVAAQKG